ncbi:MAG TPA: glutamine-hydrolyzing carbamoyl-phosphate synthase small subunit [Ktedonobacterales bacterium]|nr:glutamine-hydrolyzing carbamoyl-phosphate synthase small subunit [Ktedonobacterales bacterium]
MSDLVAALALEDGTIFYGKPFGSLEALESGRRGEVVFVTAMTGYQEICTDPSYRGQMVTMTYPLIGNYGIADEDVESRRPWISALIVREWCDEYSNWRGGQSIDDYLRRNGIPGIYDLDTRALTRHLREAGSLRAVIRLYHEGEQPDVAALVAAAKRVLSVSELDVVGEVSTETLAPWETKPVVAITAKKAKGAKGVTGAKDAKPPRVLLIDTGFKRNIARQLVSHGMEVIVAPHRVDLATVKEIAPDGVLLSNGPGDPESVAALVALTKTLIYDERMPVMGICLGHQIIGLAAGAHTGRLLFGHHGANHPVREVRTGRVTVTSQNHNFQVLADTLPSESGFYVSHINLSDNSVEGLAHEELPVFSVQYHPEASPGPEDNHYLFDRFAQMIERERGRLTATAG